MPNVGTLSVTLKATATAFHAGFDKARKAVRDFVGVVPGANLVLSRMGALMTTAAVAGGALFVRAQAEAIDTTAKLADRVGETTEALVGLQHAGNLAGSSAEEINAAVDKMARTMGEAAQGSESAQQALANVGLRIEDVQRLKPVELFGLIGERIQGLATEQERAAAAADLFGRSGQALLNTLALGREGIAAMEAEAEKLGLTFSRVDAAKVEAANDALTRVGAVVQGLGRTLAVELAPYIEAAANAFVEWATTGVTVGERAVDVVGDVVEGFATLADVLNIVRGAAQVAGGVAVKVFAVFAGVVGRIVQGLEKAVEILTLGFVESDIGATLHDWADAAYDMGQQWVEAGSKIADSGWDGEASEQARATFARIREEAQKAAQALADQAKAAGATGEATTKALPSQKAAGAEAKKAADAAEREAQARERIRESVEEDLRQRTFLAGLSEQQLEYGRELFEIEELRRKGFEDLAAKALLVLGLEKRTAEQAKLRKEEASREESIQANQKKSAEHWQKVKEAAAGTTRSMQREVELLRATNEGARERLRIQHELTDAIEAANGNQEQERLAAERAELKLAELARSEAEDAARKAEAEKKATDEKQKQVALVRNLADITKRFANFGGTSIFGFGAGQVGTGLGDIGGASARANAAAAGPGNKGKGAAAPGVQQAAEQAAKAIASEAKPLEDLAPFVQASTQQLKRMGDLWQRLGSGLRDHTAEVTRLFDRSAGIVEHGMSALAKGQADLRRRQTALEERVARAVALGVGGT